MRLLVNIDVPELEPARAFYVAAFGLTEGRRFGTGGIELFGLDAPLYLLAKPAGSPAVPGRGLVRDYGRHWTPIHLDIVVEDVAAALSRALAAGAVLEAPLRHESWGSIAGLADPFGNGFCLLAFTAAGYDAVADPAQG
ncbi:MAG TPA: VOC family protein [Xanthobacteraceae bacterium]|nr:VOC family protein [Xanthobacteraceae bacterium]